MDIVTHAMAGVILAAPLALDRPLTAAGVVFGSVLPDLDAFARLWGKRAFLRWHQTYTHSVFAVAACGLMLIAATWVVGSQEWYAGLGLAFGMSLHIALDLTNTYGVALFSPVSAKRYCLEWVFFIDSVVVALSLSALTTAVVGLFVFHADLAMPAALTYCGLLAIYVLGKAGLQHAAMRRAPFVADAMIPSALWPWVWYAHRRELDRSRLSTVNLLRRTAHEEVVAVDDVALNSVLTQCAAYRLLRDLSVGYRAVVREQTEHQRLIRCRDLRVRNFGGRFGQLDLVIDADGRITSEVLHV